MIMVLFLTGDAITIVAQTIKVENSKVQEVTPQCVMLLWDCIELYRVITEHIIRMTGLSPEVRYMLLNAILLIVQGCLFN